MNKYIFLTVTACAAIGAAWTGCGGNSGTGGSGTGGVGGKPTSSTSKMSTTKTSSTTGPTAGPGGAGGSSGFGGAGGGAVIGIQCNPVTNAGCNTGEACDISTNPMGGVAGFVCYMPPNNAQTCGACDPTGQTGPFCMGGGTCIPTSQTAGECARYCCTDADCGAEGMCDVKDMLFAPVATSLGICVAKPSTGTGGSGTGGSGTGGAGGSASSSSSSGSASSSSSSGSASSSTASSSTTGGTGGGPGSLTLACMPPATAPSNGSCVTVGK